MPYSCVQKGGEKRGRAVKEGRRRKGGAREGSNEAGRGYQEWCGRSNTGSRL